VFAEITLKARGMVNLAVPQWQRDQFSSWSEGMDGPRQTDERLRFGLNGDQPRRERMCLGILALDRRYSDLRPRRPEGGPDGGRDIECLWLNEPCFGAVGFLNSCSDSAPEKRQVFRKFRDDLKAASAASPDLKSFVFFCNVDMTPAEIQKLQDHALQKGFTHVDIYWRERIRIALDGVEGLALRFQYLGISLSEAEQASFFARYGKDLEDLVRGRFDRIEQKLDDLEFYRWKAGFISSVCLEVDFKESVRSAHERPEHFRVCLELQGIESEKRSIFIGGRDDFWETGDGRYYFGVKTFFWRERAGRVEDSWIEKNVRIGGGWISGITISLSWRPRSNILVAEFDQLGANLHFTENLINRISRVRFRLDDYTVYDRPFEIADIDQLMPNAWPDQLSAQEAAEWRCKHIGSVDLGRPLQKRDRF
jgi:hypothetical protein